MGPPSRGQSRRHHPRSPSPVALDDLPFEPLAAPLHGHHSGPASYLSCTWPCTGLIPAPGLTAVEAVTWQRARWGGLGVYRGCPTDSTLRLSCPLSASSIPEGWVSLSPFYG